MAAATEGLPICLYSCEEEIAVMGMHTPQTKIMTSQILGSVEAGRFGVAFAYCTVLIVIVMSVIGLMTLFTSEGLYRRVSARRWRNER